MSSPAPASEEPSVDQAPVAADAVTSKSKAKRGAKAAGKNPVKPSPNGVPESTPVAAPPQSTPASAPQPPAGKTILEKLRALHLDEFAQLARTDRAKRLDDGWFKVTIRYIGLYLEFLWDLWWHVTWSTVTLALNPFDLVSLIIVSAGSSIILFGLLIYCSAVRIPIVQRGWKHYQKKHGGGLSLVNASHPLMFNQLTDEQVKAARTSLCRSSDYSSNTISLRVFDYDIAKLLFQFSALMYEHHSDATQEIVKDARHAMLRNPEDSMATTETPGRLMQETCGAAAEDINLKLKANEGDGAIATFINQFGISYAPVSELNGVSSAYAALFWCSTENWIVVAFKGTSPTEFEEWLTDFSFVMTDAGEVISGFSKVHAGFKKHIFPHDVTESGGRRPYDTIAASVKIVAAALSKNVDEDINVYFTGHSLGCATASLAYSRAVSNKSDFGKKAKVRDAYLFAAPIVCDVGSVRAFNNMMSRKLERPRTMWRITNKNDAVATMLPEFGDRPRPGTHVDNVFNFAHLGTEIKMGKKPTACKVTGNHILRGTPVTIASQFPANDIGTLPADQEGRAFDLENLPVVGAFISHGTGYYWEAMQKMKLGRCEWVDN